MKTITRSRISNSCDYAIEMQKEAIDLLKNKYYLDFEKNRSKLNNMETLFKTIEYMRKKYK